MVGTERQALDRIERLDLLSEILADGGNGTDEFCMLLGDTPPENPKRVEQVRNEISWWEFIAAENRSQEFRDRLGYAVQALVALRPKVGSARTVGSIYAQLLLGQFDLSRPTEQILNAPTNEAWFDPWIDHLDSRGAELHAN